MIFPGDLAADTRSEIFQGDMVRTLIFNIGCLNKNFSDFLGERWGMCDGLVLGVARGEGRVIRFGIVSIGDGLDLRYGTGDLYIKGGRFRDWG